MTDINKAVALFEKDDELEGLRALDGLNPSFIDNIIFSEATKSVTKTFDEIKKDVTDPTYVSMKGKFPYVDAKYTEDKFDKYFPVSKWRFVQPVYVVIKDYWVQVFTEIDAYVTKDIFITRPGIGGSIMQVFEGAKDAALKGERPLNPFDYVSITNAFKSALTNSIGNAQSRFKINADFYKRIILSKEQLDAIKTEIQFIRNKVQSPRDKTSIKERYTACKSAGDKVRLLHILREEFDITNVVETEEPDLG